MRMTASWLGSNDPTAYKSVARRCALMASSPRILNRLTHRYRADTEPTQKAPWQFIVATRAQTSRRCETQAPLGGKPPSSATVSVPCPPSARSANLIAGDGTKNGFLAPNKEPTTNQKLLLDRKSPIQVRIQLAPPRSQRQTVLDHCPTCLPETPPDPLKEAMRRMLFWASTIRAIFATASPTFV